VDRRDIIVPEIHRTGTYKVQVKLHSEVTAEINLEVVSH
jgi:large subunit ribosomal protein L9